MSQSGRCYCGAARYSFDGAPVINAQCHCRECQYISGGNPNVVLGVPEASFRYTSGAPKTFRRSDLEQPASREFCAECGTHLLTRSPRAPGLVIVKRGTMDDPAAFGNPQVAIFTCDRQPWHHIPDGLATFERRPG
jgi:hypothetical protein